MGNSLGKAIKISAATIAGLIITASLWDRWTRKPSAPVATVTAQSPTPIVFSTPTPTPAPLTAAEKENMRRVWANIYQGFVQSENTHLNYIDVKLVKHKRGYTLYATHEYFTQYTFTIGSFGPNVANWIGKSRSSLLECGITRVGVAGRGEYASYAWYDVD